MNTPHWFSNLAYWSAQVALLVLAAGFLPHIFKIRQPRVLLIYWRALIVVSLLLPFAQPWRRAEIFTNVNFAPRIGGFAPIVIATSAPAPRWHLPSAQIIAEIIGVIILVGIAARFTILALGLVKLRQFRQSSSPISNHAESSAVLDAMRVRVNTVGEFRLSSDISSPVTFGLTAPVILLPERFPTLHAQYQSAIACHELLHVLRRDWAHHLSEEIIRAALWFHPAIAWLIARIRLSREQVVDLEVIKLTDARKPYLEALLEFTNSRALPAAIPAPPFLVERQLAERVALMLKEVRMSRTRLIASLTAIIASLAVVATLVVWTFPLKAAPKISLPPIQSTDNAVIQFVRSGVAGGVTVSVPNGVGVTVGGVTHGVPGGIAGNVPSQGVKGGVSGGVNTNGPVTLTDSYVGPAGPTIITEIPRSAASQPAPKIVVTDIKFEGEVHDADTVRARVLKGINGREWDGSNKEWLDEIAEVGVRGDFQDRGYFEVNVDGIKSQVLESTPTQQRVVASFKVTEGDQFRAGAFTLVEADPMRDSVIPVSQLREQFHLQTGDILNLDELRHGIQRIANLYGALGYMDMTVTPNFDIDHKGRTVAMKFKLAEGIQYHIGSITVRGLDSATTAKLQSMLPPGSLYNSSLVRELVAQGNAASGGSVPYETAGRVTRNAAARTVDIVFDFSVKSPEPAQPTNPPTAKLQYAPSESGTQKANSNTNQVPPTKTPQSDLNDRHIVGKFQTLPPATASSGKFQPIPTMKSSSLGGIIVGQLPETNQGVFVNVAPSDSSISRNPNSQNTSKPVYRAGENGVTMPKCIFCPKPEYSDEARDAKLQGTTYLQVTVLTTGRAGEIKLIKGFEKSLDEQAIKVVREQWTFKPATDQNGDSVDVIVPVEIAFQFYGPPQPTTPPVNPVTAKQSTPPLASSESLQTKIFTGPVTDNAASSPFYMGLVNTQTLYAPQPELPSLARQAHVQGSVTVNVIVNPEGKVIEVKYVKGPGMLAQSAIDAVRNWIIKGTHDGAPVTFQISVEVSFSTK